MQRAPEQLSPLPPFRGQHGMWLRWQCIAGVTAVSAVARVQIQIADSASASHLYAPRCSDPTTVFSLHHRHWRFWPLCWLTTPAAASASALCSPITCEISSRRCCHSIRISEYDSRRKRRYISIRWPQESQRNSFAAASSTEKMSGIRRTMRADPAQRSGTILFQSACDSALGRGPSGQPRVVSCKLVFRPKLSGPSFGSSMSGEPRGKLSILQRKGRLTT